MHKSMQIWSRGSAVSDQNFRMGKKCEDNANLLKCSYTTVSVKNKKHPVSSSSAGRNALLMREVRRRRARLVQGDSNANNHTL